MKIFSHTSESCFSSIYTSNKEKEDKKKHEKNIVFRIKSQLVQYPSDLRGTEKQSM